MRQYPIRSHQRNQSGFALVIALSLMAFVLVLLVSMTLLINVEIVSSQSSLNQLQAKENARLALMMALGDLQRYAGPDQRVTARAEILGITNNNRFWTGVWDSSDETVAPKWLVSGAKPDPTIEIKKSILLEHGYDHASDGDLSGVDDYREARAELVSLDDNTSYAWWVIDEGVKAPVSVMPSLEVKAGALLEDERYLDYNLATKRLSAVLFDRNFDFSDFFDINDPTSKTAELLERAFSRSQAEVLFADNTEQSKISTSLVHSLTLRNQFVLSNTLDGGLKKDLSFIKTLDASSTSQTALDTAFGDPDGMITKDALQMLQFRGDPTAFPVDEIMGMQLPEVSVAAIDAKVNDFTVAPVVTEFKLSAGIVADSMGLHNSKEDRDIESSSPVYLVYKIYLELWNPYTIPMRVGEPAWPTSLGYSDIKVEIKNLPSFVISENSPGVNSFLGSIPDISRTWSSAGLAPKTLRPGMVLVRTLPEDSKGDQNSGAFHEQIGSSTIGGAASSSYTGTFTFGGSPVEIIIYGVDSASNQREILTVSLDGYDDFIIDYDGSQVEYRFKRQREPASAGGSTSETNRAMSKASLEVPGYAFGISFKAISDQRTDASSPQDISNWLSQSDPRVRSIEVDLSDWDINDNAWGENPLPYDFRVNPSDTELGDFDPSTSFQINELFQFVSSGSPREDRIARFIDLPTQEITDIGIFRSLKYKDYAANSVGNPWGGKLNKLYDRYFFSTLSDSTITTWDGVSPLANGRIRSTTATTTLDNANTATSLILANGFNLNSTSIAAWKSVLAAKDFPPSTLELRDERAEYGDEPEWRLLADPLANVYFNNPHSAVHNSNDGHPSESYQLVTRENSPNYTEAFSLEDKMWETVRQHPAFIQNIRELTDGEVEALSKAIVIENQNFYTDNGHPPLSLSEYINSSILQNAINSVVSINLRSTGVDFIPAYAPSYFSQATILNLLGAFSFVRSDTFRIRAYGEYAALDGNTAGVYCEALVQRLPDSHSNSEMGRSFKIVSLHWITP